MPIPLAQAGSDRLGRNTSVAICVSSCTPAIMPNVSAVGAAVATIFSQIASVVTDVASIGSNVLAIALQFLFRRPFLLIVTKVANVSVAILTSLLRSRTSNRSNMKAESGQHFAAPKTGDA